MKKLLPSLLFAIFAHITAYSQQNYTPVAVNGFNADIIANTGPAAPAYIQAEISTTALFGGGHVFYAKDYRGAYNPNSEPVDGFPMTRRSIRSISNPRIFYSLADYSSPNALIIDTNNVSATLHFASPAHYDSLAILACSANQLAEIKATIHFTDGSSVLFSFIVNDWYNHNNYAMWCLGRVTVPGEEFENGDSNPRLYDHIIGLNEIDRKKLISGITFRSCNRIYDITQTAIFAISGKTESSFPIEVSGFNHDLIANGGPPENNNIQASLSTTAGFGDSYVLFSEDFIGADNFQMSHGGLPVNRTIPSMINPMINYHLNDYSENNALFLPGVGNSGTLWLSDPASFDKISILATSYWKDSKIEAVVKFSDGSSGIYYMTMIGWLSADNSFIPGILTLLSYSDAEGYYTPHIYDYILSLKEEDQKKTISAITFKNLTNTYPAIFALCGISSLPGKPETLPANHITETSFEAHWKSVPNVSSYQVDISLDSTFSENCMVVHNYNTHSTDTLIYFVELPESVCFYFRVRGTNQFGEGIYSDVRKIETSATLKFSVSPAIIHIPEGYACPVKIAVNSNAPWSATSDEDWLGSYKGSGNDTVILVPVNINKTERTAHLVFTCNNITESVEVTQAGCVPASIPFMDDFQDNIGTTPMRFTWQNQTDDSAAVWRIDNSNEIPPWGSSNSKMIFSKELTEKDVNTRLISIPFDFSKDEEMFLSFSVYEIGTNSNSYIQVQASVDDAKTWVNVGDPIHTSLYYSSNWFVFERDLSVYAGNPCVHLSLLIHQEISTAVYIGHFHVLTVTNSSVYTETPRQINSDAAILTGWVFRNIPPSIVSFEYGLTTDYDSVVYTTVELNGYYYDYPESLIKNLIQDTIYHYRIKAENAKGTLYGRDVTFRTLSDAQAPEIVNVYEYQNDGVREVIMAILKTHNCLTNYYMEYGNDPAYLKYKTSVGTIIQSMQYVQLTIDDVEEQTTYYYRVVAYNSLDTVYSEIENFVTKEATYAVESANNALFKGRYVNTVINSRGNFGEAIILPSDMHQYRNFLGFFIDPEKDGWYKGPSYYSNDLINQYEPDEGWAISFNGHHYTNNKYENKHDIAGVFTAVYDSAGSLYSRWKGTVNGIIIDQKVIMPEDSMYITTQLTLRNNTNATMHDLYYLRNINPGNDSETQWLTLNANEFQNPDGDDYALASAAGLITNSYIGLGTSDNRARSLIDPLENRNPAWVWEQGNNYVPEGSMKNNDCLALSFFVDSLPALSCTSLSFAYIFEEDKLETAMLSTIADLSVNGTIADSDTIEVSSGTDVPLSIINGSSYSWSWSPATGLNTNSGASIIAGNVTVPVTYTATGTYMCFNKTFTVTLIPKEVVHIETPAKAAPIIFPNPAQNHFTITTATNTGSYSLYTLNGVLLLQENFKGYSHVVDIADLESGTYILRVNTDNEVKFFKIIKQ